MATSGSPAPRSRPRTHNPELSRSATSAKSLRLRISDEELEAALMQQVMRTSTMQDKRPSMPISYLRGTSMIKHETGDALAKTWCRVHGAAAKGTEDDEDADASWQTLAVATRSETFPRAPTGGAGPTLDSSRPHTAGPAAGATTTTTTPPAVLGRQSLKRPNTTLARSRSAAREETSSDALYTALYPNIQLQHIARPGSSVNNPVFQTLRRQHPELPPEKVKELYSPIKKSVLSNHMPVRLSTTTSTAFPAPRVHVSSPDALQDFSGGKTHRIPAGMFSKYMDKAIIKNVDYHKVGH